MGFISIDVETANSNYSSICQVGIVKVDNNEIVEEWQTLIDPEVEFAEKNISIHGITPEDIEWVPNFPEYYPAIESFLSNNISVSHSPFDKNAIDKVCSKYKLKKIETTWLDSMKIVRRAWPECSKKGYGLSNLAKKLGWVFKHHDALEDARFTANLVLRILQETDTSINDWIVTTKKSISKSKKFSVSPNPQGSMSGEVVVFTGKLSISRREAAERAAKLGCRVDKSVTQKTTILVIGEQDKSRLGGKTKSAKEINTEKLTTDGYSISILSENEFFTELSNE